MRKGNEGMKDTVATLAFFLVWAFSALMSIGFVGVCIWAVVKLVLWACSK